jgi:hypothetical protein
MRMDTVSGTHSHYYLLIRIVGDYSKVVKLCMKLERSSSTPSAAPC